jgi:NADH-quinone oxidoreductase subunit C
MSTRVEKMRDALKAAFPDNDSIRISLDLVVIDVSSEHLLTVCQKLHDDPTLSFKQMSDLAGVDYATYGVAEWSTDTGNMASFSRAVNTASTGSLTFDSGLDLPASDQPRFWVAYHLLSLDHNVRVRVRCAAPDDSMPVLPSVTPIWSCADWYEREAFDLFGILFDGHADLRRILTDYGFNGHPFRKDFPLIGNVEMRYDSVKERVVYEPVSIEPRVLVPRVIREDSRYAAGESASKIASISASEAAKKNDA